MFKTNVPQGCDSGSQFLHFSLGTSTLAQLQEVEISQVGYTEVGQQ